jgi:hypothetical protein
VGRRENCRKTIAKTNHNLKKGGKSRKIAKTVLEEKKTKEDC